VVAMGLLKWVDCTVCDPSFFKLLTDSTPVHLALLDEVSCGWVGPGQKKFTF